MAINIGAKIRSRRQQNGLTQKELADEYKKELKIYTEAVNAAENRWKTALEKLQAML